MTTSGIGTKDFADLYAAHWTFAIQEEASMTPQITHIRLMRVVSNEYTQKLSLDVQSVQLTKLVVGIG